MYLDSELDQAENLSGVAHITFLVCRSPSVICNDGMRWDMFVFLEAVLGTFLLDVGANDMSAFSCQRQSNPSAHS